MQLRKILLLLGFLFGGVFSCVASTGEDPGEIDWQLLADNHYTLSGNLSSDLSFEGVHYKKQKLSGDWVLQLSSVSGARYLQGSETIKVLDGQDLEQLILLILVDIEQEHGGNLDKIHLSLGGIDEVRSGIAELFRYDSSVADRTLEAKDIDLAKIFANYISQTGLIQSICENAVAIGKKCAEKFVDLNAVTFSENYLGQKGHSVADLPDLGMPIDKLWFSVRLTNEP